MPKNKTVLIMAGGTGGHVFPALATAERLRAHGFESEWLGTDRGIEARVVPEAGITLHTIDVFGVRGKGIKSVLLAPFQVARAIWQARAVIRQVEPCAVLGMGGFASGPGGIAAWLMRCPLVIHEQNAKPGTTNRLLARFAKRVMAGYPVTISGRDAEFVGNPVRREIAELPAPEQRWSERSGSLRLLVLGGSLGAKAINEAMPQMLAAIPAEARPEVWHQAGAAHSESVNADYLERGLTARVEPFIEQMEQAYAWADLVICRAGALTVAELTAAGVGAAAGVEAEATPANCASQRAAHPAAPPPTLAEPAPRCCTER